MVANDENWAVACFIDYQMILQVNIIFHFSAELCFGFKNIVMKFDVNGYSQDIDQNRKIFFASV